LLARVQQAVGGADKLAGVHDFTETISLHMTSMPPAMQVKQMNLWVAPNHFRQESTLPFGKVIVYSDGKGGWISTPQGVQPLPTPQLNQIREELFRNYFTLLTSDRIEGRTVSSPENGVLEISDGQGNNVKIVIDEKTSLPAKEVYQEAQPGGPRASIEETFESFEDAGGIKAPKKITVNQNGAKFAEITVEEYKINSGLKPEDLSKKP
jgi:outer membrane lipoprotein-sorting protein